MSNDAKSKGRQYFDRIFTLFIKQKMEISRNAKSEQLDKCALREESSPDKQIKKTKKNLVAVSNSQKKLSPSPHQNGKEKNNLNTFVGIDEKSNSTEEIRIKGSEKLLYVKKCRQKKLVSEEIFQNYPYSNMDAYTFKEQQLRNENGELKAKVVENKDGLHLVQSYIEMPSDVKYITIDEEDECCRLNGLAVSIFNNGTIFQGIYHNGHFCGLGYELQHNGNTYIGTFKDGLKNGSGTYYWFSNNEIYSGEWHGGLPHGQGIYISGESKDKYEGMFSNGLKYGFGIETFSNGDKYAGEYLNGVAEGYGEYFWQDGSIYKGDFKHGVRHGYGIWKDQKQVYQGSYRMDRKQGLGIYKWIGKQIYKGEFRDDFRDGYGQFSSINKADKQTLLYKGCWTQGKKWEDGKPDEKKVKELYIFLDESFKISKQLDELSKKNQPRGRVGHKNCIPNEQASTTFKS